MQYVLLTHNDLDGVSCGILAKLAFGENVNVFYHSVNSLDYQVEQLMKEQGDINQTRKIYITDLSVNKDNEVRLKKFYQRGGLVQLIDHHKTSLHLNEYEWGNVKVEESEGKLASATSLFYDHLQEHNFLKKHSSLSEYVELVRQYDTWDWERKKNINAKRLNDLLFLQSIEEFEQSMIERLSTQQSFSFNEFEEKLLDIEEKKTERYIKRKKRELVQTFIGDKCVGIVYAESYHSELGNELGKEHPHLDCIAIINMGNKKIGFRTIHDHVDVSELAAKYGGGGHAKAAGCSLTQDAYREFIDKTFSLKPLRIDYPHNKMNVKQRCSLYENYEKEQYLLYKNNEDKWQVEKNYHLLPDHFLSFEEAERYIKRTFSVHLSKDEKLLHYLLDSIDTKKHTKKSKA
ncbi:DHH family phosphoesterase [Metabacillus schmidteae]|uniref:DHH family phosphoesterase n=1 Tax=Metabacillus schmidteae TaxID=2730405 RepID=UPI00158AE5B8|nr:DHHA1 domain-containing protein [Metabacillus schmidteae]